MLETLYRMIPASRETIHQLREVSADSVLQAFENQGVPFNLVRLCEGDWELEYANYVTDDEMIERIGIASAGHEGNCFVLTDNCFRDRVEPRQCQASQIVSTLLDEPCDPFYGDIIIVAEQSRTITVLHHAGLFAHVIS